MIIQEKTVVFAGGDMCRRGGKFAYPAKKSEEPKGRTEMVNKPKKICLLCAYWLVVGEAIKIVRWEWLCSMSGNVARMHDTCWGWKKCSPGQLELRKKAGLIEEVGTNG